MSDLKFFGINNFQIQVASGSLTLSWYNPLLESPQPSRREIWQILRLLELLLQQQEQLRANIILGLGCTSSFGLYSIPSTRWLPFGREWLIWKILHETNIDSHVCCSNVAFVLVFVRKLGSFRQSQHRLSEYHFIALSFTFGLIAAAHRTYALIFSNKIFQLKLSASSHRCGWTNTSCEWIQSRGCICVYYGSRTFPCSKKQWHNWLDSRSGWLLDRYFSNSEGRWFPHWGSSFRFIGFKVYAATPDATHEGTYGIIIG